jgi:hypothetical protein
MKRSLALALCLGILAPAAGVDAAGAGVSDSMCPGATKPVRDYVEKTKNPATSLDEAVALAQKAVDAYDLCASEALGSGATDNLHYAQLWSARYEYAIGGWQHLAENDGLARVALERSIALAQEIIDWRPASQVAYGSNDVNVGQGSVHNANANSSNSRFHDEAVQVRDAALKALAQLSKPGAASPAPATAAPAPAPSAT